MVTFLKNEILSCKEIEHLIPPNELKQEMEKREKEKKKRIEKKVKKLKFKKELGKMEEEKEDLVPFEYSRWSISYNTVMDYKTEENEEFLFYQLSNSLISEFTKDQKCFKKRIELINIIINLFEDVYSKIKEGKNICKYFEFLCLILINSEVNDNYATKLRPILESISNEIKNKFMNFDEINKYLKKKNYKSEYIDNKIIINYNNTKFIIDDYNKYNIDKTVIKSLLNKDRLSYKTFLENNIKFEEHLNEIKNSNDLLIKIIKKFSCSELAFSSIEKLFSIKREEHEELFKELSCNIEQYVCLIPYNCFFDTERTVKNPMKIIIEPYREKYRLEIKNINNDLELHSVLKDFCNIAFRKFCFEHEIHHLTTCLLFFLYVHENSSINSITKELTSNGDVLFHPETEDEDMIEKTGNNVQKEAGNLFELLCYGNIIKQFTLKQLLFIVNENNDNLRWDKFKESYENNSKKNIKQLLNEFPDNQLLSGYVKKIKECIEKNSQNSDIEKTLNKAVIVFKDEEGDNVDVYSKLNGDETSLVSEFERHDNHWILEKRPIYKIKKKKK